MAKNAVANPFQSFLNELKSQIANNGIISISVRIRNSLKATGYDSTTDQLKQFRSLLTTKPNGTVLRLDVEALLVVLRVIDSLSNARAKEKLLHFTVDTLSCLHDEKVASKCLQKCMSTAEIEKHIKNWHHATAPRVAQYLCELILDGQREERRIPALILPKLLGSNVQLWQIWAENAEFLVEKLLNLLQSDQDSVLRLMILHILVQLAKFGIKLHGKPGRPSDVVKSVTQLASSGKIPARDLGELLTDLSQAVDKQRSACVFAQQTIDFDGEPQDEAGDKTVLLMDRSLFLVGSIEGGAFLHYAEVELKNSTILSGSVSSKSIVLQWNEPGGNTWKMGQRHSIRRLSVAFLDSEAIERFQQVYRESPVANTSMPGSTARFQGRPSDTSKSNIFDIPNTQPPNAMLQALWSSQQEEQTALQTPRTTFIDQVCLLPSSSPLKSRSRIFEQRETRPDNFPSHDPTLAAAVDDADTDFANFSQIAFTKSTRTSSKSVSFQIDTSNAEAITSVIVPNTGSSDHGHKSDDNPLTDSDTGHVSRLKPRSQTSIGILCNSQTPVKARKKAKSAKRTSASSKALFDAASKENLLGGSSRPAKTNTTSRKATRPRTKLASRLQSGKTTQEPKATPTLASTRPRRSTTKAKDQFNDTSSSSENEAEPSQMSTNQERATRMSNVHKSAKPMLQTTETKTDLSTANLAVALIFDEEESAKHSTRASPSTVAALHTPMPLYEQVPDIPTTEGHDISDVTAPLNMNQLEQDATLSIASSDPTSVENVASDANCSFAIKLANMVQASPCLSNNQMSTRPTATLNLSNNDFSQSDVDIGSRHDSQSGNMALEAAVPAVVSTATSPKEHEILDLPFASVDDGKPASKFLRRSPRTPVIHFNRDGPANTGLKRARRSTGEHRADDYDQPRKPCEQRLGLAQRLNKNEECDPVEFCDDVSMDDSDGDDRQADDNELSLGINKHIVPAGKFDTSGLDALDDQEKSGLQLPINTADPLTYSKSAHLEAGDNNDTNIPNLSDPTTGPAADTDIAFIKTIQPEMIESLPKQTEPIVSDHDAVVSMRAEALTQVNEPVAFTDKQLPDACKSVQVEAMLGARQPGSFSPNSPRVEYLRTTPTTTAGATDNVPFIDVSTGQATNKPVAYQQITTLKKRQSNSMPAPGRPSKIVKSDMQPAQRSLSDRSYDAAAKQRRIEQSKSLQDDSRVTIVEAVSNPVNSSFPSWDEHEATHIESTPKPLHTKLLDTADTSLNEPNRGRGAHNTTLRSVSTKYIPIKHISPPATASTNSIRSPDEQFGSRQGLNQSYLYTPATESRLLDRQIHHAMQGLAQDMIQRLSQEEAVLYECQTLLSTGCDRLIEQLVSGTKERLLHESNKLSSAVGKYRQALTRSHQVLEGSDVTKIVRERLLRAQTRLTARKSEISRLFQVVKY